MGGKVLSVRISDAVSDRIDAVAPGGDRSRWVRGLIDAALSGEDRTETRKRVRRKAVSVPVREAASGSDGLDADAAALLSHLRSGGRPVRRLSDEMGWMPMRVDRVLARLGHRVRFDGGVVVASEGGAP